MRYFDFYVNADGEAPVLTFLEGLPQREASKVYVMLERLLELERLGRPYLKQFAGYPFWFGELILGDFRIFAHRLDALPGEERYLLVHAFRKKSNETPKRELNAAQRCILDYYEQRR